MYVTYNVMGYHNSVSLQMQRLTMAETPSIALFKGQKVKGQGDYSAHKSSIISR